MLALTGFVALALSLASVSAQSVPAWGQCGGIGYNGPTRSGTPQTTTQTSSPPTSTSPSGPVDTTERCGQWDSVVVGPYTIYVNQWGKDGGSGTSCAKVNSLSGTTISYVNRWNWTGGTGVKSYTNVNLNQGVGKQLSAISKIPASWKWSQTQTGTIVANVAFDLFTAASAGASNQYEIMVWVANFNAGPISAQYGSDGKPVPIVQNVNLAGKSWNLYKGSNGAQTVFSFLTSDGSQINSFSGDLNDFIKYLTANQGLSKSQYLTTVQSGTEATSGDAVFTAPVRDGKVGSYA
ncbi:glycoside hydrolase family 12 protein [Moniliophthora roreri]|nr:glycoside hydrolase family 12 protein [Moniliophthora roreri]